MMYAAGNGHTAVVELLLSRGARSVFAPNAGRAIALLIARRAAAILAAERSHSDSTWLITITSVGDWPCAKFTMIYRLRALGPPLKIETALGFHCGVDRGIPPEDLN